MKNNKEILTKIEFMIRIREKPIRIKNEIDEQIIDELIDKNDTELELLKELKKWILTE